MRRKNRENEQINRINSDFRVGLSDEQVKDRTSRGLNNVTSMVVGKSTWEIIKSNVLSFFNILLFVLAGFLLYSNLNDGNPDTKWSNGLFFVGILLLNIIIGLYQDIKAKHLMKKMRLITSSKTRVIRNGKEMLIEPSEVVLDDILLLKSGEQIIADSYIVNGEISVDESLLTGESVDVNKKIGDLIYSGTYVSTGTCYGRVERVGKDNYIEQLSHKAKAFKRNPSHIIKSLNALFKAIGILIVILFIVIITTYGLLGSFSSKETFVKSVAPIVGQFVAMIPAGLYLLTSFTLATGVISLHKKQANVQDLYSIEMLARANVLCVDKTGTITDGTMVLKDIIPTSKYDKEVLSDIIFNIINITHDDNFTAKALLKDCSPIKVVEGVSSLPFNSKNKYSGATFATGGTYLLGAIEYLNLVDKDEALKLAKPSAEKGLRVLALAKGNEPINGKTYENKVNLIGLILLQDHVKENAVETFKWFNNNHVDVKVISGDNAITVSEIAKEAGIINADKYVSLEGMDIESVKKIALDYNVFGRVTPEQKEALVIALKEAGLTVAMTGDGVNDMLALKRADCSIAMNSGAQAAKNVSHVVLMDNNFGSMPAIVAEGRRVINNLERTGSLFLTKTFFAIFASITFWIASVVSGNKYGYPFTTSNLMVWEIFAIGLSAFFISLEVNPKPIKGGFLKNILTNAIPSATTIILGVTAVYVGYILQANHIVYTGINDFGFSIASGTDPRYGATAMATLVFSALSLVVLFNVCRPINKYRGAIVIGTVVASALSFLIAALVGNNQIFALNFSKITNENLVYCFAVIAILGTLLYLIKPFISFGNSNEKTIENSVSEDL